MPGSPSSRITGVVESLAALLSAGLLVLSLVLVVLMIAAPAVAPGSGLSAASGPETGRVLVQVLVGLGGEVLHFRRRRLPAGFRPASAVAVILAVFVALWWGWWR